MMLSCHSCGLVEGGTGLRMKGILTLAEGGVGGGLEGKL